MNLPKKLLPVNCVKWIGQNCDIFWTFVIQVFFHLTGPGSYRLVSNWFLRFCKCCQSWGFWHTKLRSDEKKLAKTFMTSKIEVPQERKELTLLLSASGIRKSINVSNLVNMRKIPNQHLRPSSQLSCFFSRLQKMILSFELANTGFIIIVFT